MILSFRNFFFTLVIVFGFNPVYSQNEITIRYSASDTLIRQLASEIGSYLGKACKENTRIQNSNARQAGSINLKIDPGFHPSLMKEGFVLKGNGNMLDISANHFNGLRNGVYYYLNLLGFRFYLPGEIWTHIPELKTPFIKIDTSVYPQFANRALFPTGGFRKNLAVDPDNLFVQDWNHWLSQNLYSAEEKIDGHMGEAFNAKYKKELLADTMMLACVKGRRQWSPSAKWDISNPDFVSLFVKDRLDAFQKMKEKFPDRNVISVEPADGGGDCECDACKKMGSVSDRDFYLANKVAEAIKEKWTGGGVSLYAYNTHAAPPHITLQPNVFVTVIPYRFQNLTDPAVLLKKWSEKTGNIGVYDYWSPTDIALDIPLFNYLQQLPAKYDLWHRLHLNGFTLETGYNKFNNALAFYFFSRMIWFGETDVMEMLKKFCDENFKKASPLIFPMLERWGVNFRLRFEVPACLEEIKKAYALENDDIVQKRLDEIKAVLIYAALEDNAVSNLPKPGAEERVDSLFRYIWSVYDSRIINTGVIHNLVRRKLLAVKKDVAPQWNLGNALKNKQFWTDIVKNKPSESLSNEIINPLSVSLQPNITYPVFDEKNVDSIFSKSKRFFGEDIIKLRAQLKLVGSVLASGNGGLSLNITITEPFQNSEKLPVVALYDERGFFVEYKELKAQKGNQKIIFTGLFKNKRYGFSVYANRNFEIEILNRIFLLDGTDASAGNVQLLSTQQSNLILPNDYNYYIDPYRYNGQLLGESRKTILNKTGKVARRSQLLKYKPGEPFLRISAKSKNPFVLEVINGKALYGFAND